MKKDKIWLKEQINYFKEAVGKPAINDFSRGLNDAYDTLEKLINQLDEPDSTDEYRKGYEQGVLNAIQTANECKLVEIPQFVAEVIKKYKENDDSLGELLASVEHANIKYYHNMEKYRVDFDNLYEPIVDLCATIARAWLDGYSVEKENLYRVVLIKGKYLIYNRKNKQLHNQELDAYVGDYEQREFTEQEIKNIDERFWAFAEEVTND